MNDYFYPGENTEKAYLVGLGVRGSRPLLSVDDSLEELALLADTAGMDVVGATSQIVHHIDPSTFVGSGKVQEIKDTIEQMDVKTVIFDDELSPRHQRELEKRFGQETKVLDRSALILDIFAQHAHTREGSLQVELAQYEYRLPRLTRQWTHLARQAGGSGSKSGVGLRGPGETQLEVDKREIGRRITKLKSEIEQVRQHRSRHRQQRSKSGIPVISLVGYTNAGKSTLLKTMTGADVYTADQLFATLDPTTRRVELPSNRQVVMTDTVGFIQKLPTTLIAAFRATLEEILEADILLHVVDSAHPNVYEQIEAVEDTLAEIDVPPVPRILVWNKIDKLNNLEEIPSEYEGYEASVPISAQKGIGIDKLFNTIESALKSIMKKSVLMIPYERGDIVSELFTSATVEKQEHLEEGIKITAQLSSAIHNRLKEYIVSEE